ncbi:S8 family serine peptidase [Pseudobdellovibrio sp. HCB154]|uniref:S8 family serine peptidase n=1 Tax=Pseudobdellovibrio sp. HCB154 TaxID=3386277 RepID=UPI0039171717
MKNNFSKVSALAATMMLAVTANASFTTQSVPGEFVVKLKPGMMRASTQALSQQLKGFVTQKISGQNIVVVKKAVFETNDSAIKALNENPMVEIAEPNYIYKINKAPTDPLYVQTWGLSNVGQADPKNQVGVAGVDINAERAWEIQTGTREKIIAVIDTGIDYTHPDLVDNMWVNESEKNGKAGVDDDNNGVVDDVYGYNAITGTGNAKDDQGHGSHCAGTIGARANNGIGVAGVNWNVRMMAVKFLDAGGSGSLADAIKAIDYATKMGAHVMSNSWGGGGFSQTLMDAIKRSNEAGAIFIAAAGNEYNNNDNSPTYPSTYQVENVMSVAAIDNRGAKADFSNYGKKTVHLGAPGVNVMSTTGGSYKSFSGTSMATPHVAGVAALLWANEPNLTAAQVKERLIATVRPLASMKGKTRTGGMVDAYGALTNTQAPPDANDPSNWATVAMNFASESPYKPNTDQTFEISVPGAKEFAIYFEKFNVESGYDFVTIYDAAGNKVQTLTGSMDESFSMTITGESARVVFKSDKSVEKSGWSITKAAYR